MVKGSACGELVIACVPAVLFVGVLVVRAIFEAVSFLAAARAAVQELALRPRAVCLLVAPWAQRVVTAWIAFGTARSVVAQLVAARACATRPMARISQ